MKKEEWKNAVTRQIHHCIPGRYSDHSEIGAEHEDHVKQVLTELKEYGLFVKLEKCCSSTDHVAYLGFVICTKTPNILLCDFSSTRLSLVFQRTEYAVQAVWLSLQRCLLVEVKFCNLKIITSSLCK